MGDYYNQIMIEQINFLEKGKVFLSIMKGKGTEFPCIFLLALSLYYKYYIVKLKFHL
jgi:hypothetical protein